ncbi:hypothetical protein BRC62_08090 [Halobacteriales archaeon QH_10_67_13]|nr:MAG: hypothetical protein BRC62_08090 [Halobacteriales archaeon QH_10_67_13]
MRVEQLPGQFVNVLGDALATDVEPNSVLVERAVADPQSDQFCEILGQLVGLLDRSDRRSVRCELLAGPEPGDGSLGGPDLCRDRRVAVTLFM